MTERTVTSEDGKVWTADEFASDYMHCSVLTLDQFVEFLRVGYHIEDYERLHQLIERRDRTLQLKVWREGEDLDGRG